jgi:hypothetical protein
MCSFVAFLSIIGQSANKFSASALLTYWNVSVYSFLMHGTTFVIIVFASRILQKSASLEAPAVRTSDSESDKKEQKLGSKCSLACSRPIPYERSMILSATRYLILQLLSSAYFLIVGNRYAFTF